MKMVLSVLDVALADARAKRVHFPSTTLVPDAICCRICGVIWLTRDDWVADTGYCPGAPERVHGPDPSLTQPLSIGPLGEEG